jgi:hypothetical protein
MDGSACQQDIEGLVGSGLAQASQHSARVPLPTVASLRHVRPAGQQLLTQVAA